MLPCPISLVVASFQGTGKATSSAASATPETTVSSSANSQPIIERITEYEPLPSNGLVAQNELGAQLQLLSDQLNALIAAANSKSTQNILPENVAADGNADVPYAAVSNISKGIGRLGTMRLGDCVRFISRQKGGDQQAQGVEFCWSEFEKVHTLDKVPVHEVKDELPKGFSTRVQIEGLDEPEHWRSDDQSDLQARISKLISPFVEKQPLRVTIKIDDKDIELQKLVSDLELYQVRAV
jgi:hypothetical protein